MKLEIGGGTRNRGEDWVNLDLIEAADIRHDLNVIPWPISDESVDEIYSSHCIEHVFDACAFCRECARIGKIGAAVEIRCPDSTSEMMFMADHKSCFSITAVRNMDIHFPGEFWTGERRLKLVDVVPHCDPYWFAEARACPLFAAWTDAEILTWLPRTRHENCFHFKVIENDLHAG